MENEANNKEQAPTPTHQQGKETAEQQKDDHQFLQHLEETQPDAAKKTESPDALIGDVDPTDRVETSQEELNAEAQNKQSDSSKISGEEL